MSFALLTAPSQWEFGTSSPSRNRSSVGKPYTCRKKPSCQIMLCSFAAVTLTLRLASLYRRSMMHDQSLDERLVIWVSAVKSMQMAQQHLIFLHQLRIWIRFHLDDLQMVTILLFDPLH